MLTEQQKNIFDTIGAGYTLYKKYDDVKIISYIKDMYLIIFKGKAKKPEWIRFKEHDGLEKYLDYIVKSKRDKTQSQIERKEQAKKDNIDIIANIQVNDIYFSSWGYDQTNIDFYKVIEKKNKTIVLQKISKEIVNDKFYSHMSNSVIAKDTTEGEIYKILVKKYMRIDSYKSLYKWDGIPKTETFYA